MSLKRQNYSWLRFFNKHGEDLNFTYDATEDKWTGSIYLDKVSVDLIEYEPVYILEEVWDATTNSPLGYRKPKKANLTPWCPGATGEAYTTINAKWLDTNAGSTLSNVPEFFLWTMEGFPGPNPLVVKHDSLDIDLGDNTGDLVGPSGGGATGQPVFDAASVTPFLDEALSLRVGLQSSEEDSYTRTLQLIDPNYLPEPTFDAFGCTGATHVFCEIIYYGETEGEDERLETMIENMGSAIQNSDSKIFDDVDINEALPDFIKLNSKRKELLLEFDNIFPFVGAYKALINILNWFGYDQVTLKEYWLNVDELKGNNPEGISRIKYKQTPIEDLFSTEPKTANAPAGLIPSKLYKKTSKFGLFYDITRDKPGEFDIDGLPVVEEAFIFSNEEVLIKLFALKQKLKKYFLPLNARIVDIVGEAVYYSLYDVNVWSDSLRVDDVELNINPCVKVTPEDGCSLITDLTAQNFLGVKVPPDLNMAGVTDFASYAIGVTMNGIIYPDNYSGIFDKYLITDTVSGATIEYLTPQIGLTSGQVLDGIKSVWESQVNEPWTQFRLDKEVGQDANITLPTSYQWMYINQQDIIGPTGGVNFVMTSSVTPGATSAIYTTPGVTSVGMTLGLGPMDHYASAFMGYFDGYNTPVSELNDYPCAPIAAPFILENCSFDITWDEMVVNWNTLDFQSSGSGITGPSAWSNYSYFNYTYTHGATTNSYPLGGTNPYSGFTGPTYSGPSGGGPFTGSTPGSPLPGQTFSSVTLYWLSAPTGPTTPAVTNPGPTFAFGTPTSPTANPIIYDWENVGYANFNELEWTITYDEDPTWKIESGLMTLEDGRRYPILLPYAGNYTVDLKLYDAWGGVSRWYQPAALCVKTKDIDFLGHYRARICDYTWDTKTQKRQSELANPPEVPKYPTWDMYASTWGLPLHPNEEIQMGDLSYNDLDRIEFYQTQNDPQFQGFCDDIDMLPMSPGYTGSTGLYDLDSYRWNLIENNANWDDLCHLWWDITNPRYTQIRMNWPTTIGTGGLMNTPYLLMMKEPSVADPSDIHIWGSTSMLAMGPTIDYGSVWVNLNPTIGPSPWPGPFVPQEITGIYQYLGTGATGLGPNAWVESDIDLDVFHFTDLTNGGALTGNDIWKEFVRQYNEEMENNGDSYNFFNDFILYYQEEYEDPTNPLRPYLQWVSKDFSNRDQYHIRIYSDSPTYTSTPIFTGYPTAGVTSIYASSYDTVNFGDMGDTPWWFEIIAVGQSGGTLVIPGPSSWMDGTGSIVSGITNWHYDIMATSLLDMWNQVNYLSQGLAPTGPSAGLIPYDIEGPIRSLEWNLVYGASGYTGATTSFPPPAVLTPIKIQGSKTYFSSNDEACVQFLGPTAGQTWFGATGATNSVLGGTSGIAGTMCGRAISSNSNWNDLRIHKYAKNFPLLTQLQFNYTMSPMNGKTLSQWTLIRENDPNWENIYYNNPYFSYLFTKTGSYTLELQLTDNQGNVRTKTKNEFVKII